MEKKVRNMTEQKIHARNRLLVSVTVMLLVISVTVISLLRVHSRTEEECWLNLRSAAQVADAQMGVLLNNTFAYLENTGELLADIDETDGPTVAEEVSRSRIGDMQMEMRLYLPDGRAFTASGIVSHDIHYAGILSAFDANNRYISCTKKISFIPI